MKSIFLIFLFNSYFFPAYAFDMKDFKNYKIVIEDFPEFKVISYNVKCEKENKNGCEKAEMTVNFSFSKNIDSIVLVIEIKDWGYMSCVYIGDFEKYIKENKIEEIYEFKDEIYDFQKGSKIEIFVDSLMLKEENYLIEKGKRRFKNNENVKRIGCY